MLTVNFLNNNFLAWILPLVVTYAFLLIISIYQNKIKDSLSLDKKIRILFASVLGILFLSVTILKWTSEKEITLNNLPLQLFDINIILVMLLSINKNKQLFNFVIFVSVLCGLLNLFLFNVNYSYKTINYYVYILIYALIFLIPIYFLIIYNYIPRIKDMFNTLFYFEILFVAFIIFNTLFDTNYLYLNITKNTAPQNSIVSYLGDTPWHIIFMNLIAFGLIFIEFIIIYFTHQQKEKNSDVILDSVYHKKKKKSTFGN